MKGDFYQMQTMTYVFCFIQELGCQDVILVAMHYTFDKDYALPSRSVESSREVKLLVDCLFFEKKGLLSCSRNKNAMKTVCKEVIVSFKKKSVMV